MNKRNQGQIAANTKVGWRINEWADDIGICRASVYNLLTAGRLRSVKSGAARIITTRPVDYLASLDKEGE